MSCTNDFNIILCYFALNPLKWLIYHQLKALCGTFKIRIKIVCHADQFFLIEQVDDCYTFGKS